VGRPSPDHNYSPGCNLNDDQTAAELHPSELGFDLIVCHVGSTSWAWTGVGGSDLVETTQQPVGHRHSLPTLHVRPVLVSLICAIGKTQIHPQPETAIISLI